MTLTQQFVVISVLPASFLVLVFFALRRASSRMRWRWVLVLLTAGVWSSSALSYYGGTTMAVEVAFSWRVIGHYALSLLSFWLLVATISYLEIQDRRGRLTGLVALGLWLLAVALDPAWPYEIPDVMVGGQAIRQFDLWGAVWATSWLLPILSAWLLTQRATRYRPGPMYRNKVHYWLLTVGLFIIGSGFGLTRQLVWLQFGALVAFVAGLVGTVGLTRRHLPSLQLMTRRLTGRLLAGLIILGLTWFALVYLIQTARLASNSLELLFPAFLFAIFVLVTYHLINRLFAPPLVRRSADFSAQVAAASSLSDPAALGRLALTLAQAQVSTDDAWVMLVEDGPGGRLAMRPLVSLGEQLPEPGVFAARSRLIDYWRENPLPLTQYDIEDSEGFEDLASEDRKLIAEWHRELYVPLYVGDQLLGLLGLGEKHSGGNYDNQDIHFLQALAEQLSPLFVQTQNVNALQRLNGRLFAENQRLLEERRYLLEVTEFFTRFLGLLSPELRRPYDALDRELRAAREALAPSGNDQQLESLANHVEQLKGVVNGLIVTAARVEKQGAFAFQEVEMEGVIRQAIENLASMADARRVAVVLEIENPLRPVHGDPEHLTEAVQHLLHNAIKFNKIGGQVQIACSANNGELKIDVVDNGVGIPPERLENLWTEFTNLDNLSTSTIKGAGLGVPVSNFVVQAHGGRLEAASKYGSGSTFTIHLPMVLAVPRVQ